MNATDTDPIEMHVDGTTPYPWPWDGRFHPSRSALVVTGWDGGWAARCAGEDVDDAAARLRRVADALAAAGGLVVTARHHDPAAGEPPVAVHPASLTVTATGIDAFTGSDLDGVLRRERRDLVLLGGLGLETTVHSTMRSANDRGLECLLLVDGAAPSAPALVPAAVSMVEMSGGIFGAAGTTVAVVAALDALDALAARGAPGPLDHLTPRRWRT